MLNIPPPTEYDDLPPLGDLTPEDLPAVASDLDFVVDVLNREEVRGFFGDPAIKRKGKQAALWQIIEPEVHPILTHFLISLAGLAGIQSVGAEGKGFRPKHYATAFLEMALMLGCLDKVVQQMVTADSVLSMERVKAFLASSSITEQGKSQALRELLSPMVHPAVVILILFMYRMRNLDDFEATIRECITQLGNTTGDFGGQLVTAIPISPSKLAEVEKAVSEYFLRPVTLSSRVDPSMLGGALVVVGDTVLDASIEHRLAKMREQLLTS